MGTPNGRDQAARFESAHQINWRYIRAYSRLGKRSTAVRIHITAGLTVSINVCVVIPVCTGRRASAHSSRRGAGCHAVRRRHAEGGWVLPYRTLCAGALCDSQAARREREHCRQRYRYNLHGVLLRHRRTISGRRATFPKALCVFPNLFFSLRHQRRSQRSVQGLKGAGGHTSTPA